MLSFAPTTIHAAYLLLGKMEDIKYSVTAYIDLLGFSNHLEISCHDIRPNIGKEAVKRLDILEQVLEKIEEETKGATNYFPHPMHTQRINNALILTIDLPEMLICDNTAKKNKTPCK